MPISVVQPHSPADWHRARTLIEQYAASLGVDLSFQNIDHELTHLTVEYAPPHGAFLLAHDATTDLGCIALRRHSTEIAEIKRLYVSLAARGRGLGRMLAEAIIARARELGYVRLRLDALRDMTAA